MKIQGIGTIASMNEGEEKGTVDLVVEFKGKVAPETGDKVLPLPAKDAHADVTLNVRVLIAQQLKWGQQLFLTITDEVPKDA